MKYNNRNDMNSFNRMSGFSQGNKISSEFDNRIGNSASPTSFFSQNNDVIRRPNVNLMGGTSPLKSRMSSRPFNPSFNSKVETSSFSRGDTEKLRDNSRGERRGNREYTRSYSKSSSYNSDRDNNISNKGDLKRSSISRKDDESLEDYGSEERRGNERSSSASSRNSDRSERRSRNSYSSRRSSRSSTEDSSYEDILKDLDTDKVEESSKDRSTTQRNNDKYAKRDTSRRSSRRDRRSSSNKENSEIIDIEGDDLEENNKEYSPKSKRKRDSEGLSSYNDLFASLEKEVDSNKSSGASGRSRKYESYKSSISSSHSAKTPNEVDYDKYKVVSKRLKEEKRREEEEESQNEYLEAQKVEKKGFFKKVFSKSKDKDKDKDK